MQEARPEADARRHPGPIADEPAHPLQLLHGVRIRGKVGQEGEVVACTRRVEQGAHGPVHGHRIVAERGGVTVGGDPRLRDQRGRLRQGAVPAVRVQQAARGVLGRLHVRLVERIDPQHDPGRGGRHLPAHELGADLERVRQLDVLARMPQLLEIAGQARPGRVSVIGQRDDDELAVRAVRRRGADRLPDHRDDARSGLAGAFGHQLLDPVAQAGEARGGEDGQLVPPGQRRLTDGGAQLEAGIAHGRTAAGLGHPFGTRQQAVEVDPVERRGQQPKDREGAVTAADIRLPVDDGPEALRAGELRQHGARIGDGDEVERGGVRAHRRVEGVRLGRRA